MSAAAALRSVRCTPADHAALKSDRATFVAGATYIGHQGDLPLHNCNACSSTLVFPGDEPADP